MIFEEKESGCLQVDMNTLLYSYNKLKKESLIINGELLMVLSLTIMCIPQKWTKGSKPSPENKQTNKQKLS